AEHRPHRGHLLCILAMDDFSQRLPLTGVGALIDDDLHRAIAFMHRARKAHDHSGAKTIQADIPIMTPIDLITGNGPAVAVRGWCVKLARASVAAVAVGKFATPYFPCGSHLSPQFEYPRVSPAGGPATHSCKVPGQENSTPCQFAPPGGHAASSS